MEWIAWARAPGHDSFWQFHRAAFGPLFPSPGRLTLDIGCGERQAGRDRATLGHPVGGLDGSTTTVRAVLVPELLGGIRDPNQWNK
jgi:hypothetical protein